MHRYDRYVWGLVSHPGGITITLMDARVAMNTAGALSLIHNIFRHPTSDSGKIWISYFLGVKAQTNMNTFSHWHIVYKCSVYLSNMFNVLFCFLSKCCDDKVRSIKAKVSNRKCCCCQFLKEYYNVLNIIWSADDKCGSDTKAGDWVILSVV